MPRILQSFTLRVSIFVLAMALLTSITLYKKEVASVVRMYANVGMAYSLTAQEGAHFRQSAVWYFLIFSFPLVPLLISTGRKHIQITIAILAVAVAILAAYVTPGGDRKGCDECFGPILFSVASTTFITLFSGLWIVIAYASRLFSRRIKNLSKNSE